MGVCPSVGLNLAVRPAMASLALLLLPSMPSGAGTPIRTYKYEGRVACLAFSPSGRMYAISIDGEHTNLIETESGKTLKRLRMGSGFAQTVAYSADERMFASSMLDKDRSGQTAIVVRVWDLPSGRQRHDFWGPEAEVVSLAFSPDGKLLAGGDRDGTVTVWSVESGKVQGTFDSQTTDPRAVFAGGIEDLVTAGEDGALRVWDAKGFGLRQTLVAKEGDAYLCISYSAAKNVLCTLDSSGAVDVWRGPRWKNESTIELQRRGYKNSTLNTAVALAPDAGLVAAPDGIGVSVTDIRTGKRVAEYEPAKRYEITRLSLSPDGRLLLIAARHFVEADTEVFLWRVGKEDAGAVKPGTRPEK